MPVEFDPITADGTATIEQCADFLGLSQMTVRRLIETRELPSCLIRSRRMVPRRALRELLDEKLAAEPGRSKVVPSRGGVPA